MSDDLTAPQREQLQRIEHRLAEIAGLLQYMASTIETTSWDIEDALLNDEAPSSARLHNAVAVHSDEVLLLLNRSKRLLIQVAEYEEAETNELERAIGVLHTAGVLPPAFMPPDPNTAG